MRRSLGANSKNMAQLVTKRYSYSDCESNSRVDIMFWLCRFNQGWNYFKARTMVVYGWNNCRIFWSFIILLYCKWVVYLHAHPWDRDRQPRRFSCTWWDSHSTIRQHTVAILNTTTQNKKVSNILIKWMLECKEIITKNWHLIKSIF
jgi:hypothetical protein